MTVAVIIVVAVVAVAVVAVVDAVGGWDDRSWSVKDLRLFGIGQDLHLVEIVEQRLRQRLPQPFNHLRARATRRRRSILVRVERVVRNWGWARKGIPFFRITHNRGCCR